MAWFKRRRWLWPAILLGLAGLEAWTGYRARSAHPYLALADAVVAIILILGVLFTR